MHNKIIIYKNTKAKNKFIKYVERNKNIIIDAIEKHSETSPPIFDNVDYRFLISHYMSYLLENKTNGRLKTIKGEEYDMVFDNKTRISIKLLKDAFQRTKKRGEGLTKPKSLIMKNCFGVHDNIDYKKIFDIDYLMTVDRNPSEIGFGIIHINKLKKRFYTDGTDQIKCEISDDDYDILCKKILNTKEKPSHKNKQFHELLNSVFEKLSK